MTWCTGARQDISARRAGPCVRAAFAAMYPGYPAPPRAPTTLIPAAPQRLHTLPHIAHHQVGRGVTENKHSLEVESPPAPRVCMSIHPKGKCVTHALAAARGAPPC
jgi:hypothetical protein